MATISQWTQSNHYQSIVGAAGHTTFVDWPGPWSGFHNGAHKASRGKGAQL
jgi:hypothetical protein